MTSLLVYGWVNPTLSLSLPLYHSPLLSHFPPNLAPSHPSLIALFILPSSLLPLSHRKGRRGQDKVERKGRKMPLTIVYVWRRDEAESLADYLVIEDIFT
jgi:hypothetical protein